MSRKHLISTQHTKGHYQQEYDTAINVCQWHDTGVGIIQKDLEAANKKCYSK